MTEKAIRYLNDYKNRLKGAVEYAKGRKDCDYSAEQALLFQYYKNAIESLTASKDDEYFIDLSEIEKLEIINNLTKFITELKGY